MFFAVLLENMLCRCQALLAKAAHADRATAAAARDFGPENATAKTRRAHHFHQFVGVRAAKADRRIAGM